MKLWSVDEKLNKIENTVVWGRNYREEWEDAAATVAKIMVTETAGLAAVKAARHDEPKAANDDDEVLLTTSETAEVLEVSAHTVRKWTIEGRPIIGRRRKKKDELKAKQVGGHLRFEAASVHALANKLKAYGLR